MGILPTYLDQIQNLTFVVIAINLNHNLSNLKLKHIIEGVYRLLDSLVVECLHRVREVPGSIPSQGPRHTKDVIKMVEHSKGKILALSQKLR